MSYSDFLIKVYAGEIELNFKDLPSAGYNLIDQNVQVIKDYEYHGLNFIIKKYLKKTKNKLIATGYSDENFFGLIQIMFFEEYYVHFEDISPALIFIKAPLGSPKSD